MNKLRVHLFVTGRVQGVFFRQSLKVTAKKNDCKGWVRNLEDGRVEATIEGQDVNVNEVIEWCRIGPANSRVDKLEVKNEEYANEFTEFKVLY
jgi:acylphosphatase